MTDNCTSCQARVINLLKTIGNSDPDGLSYASEEYIVHNAGVSLETLKYMVKIDILKTFNGKFKISQVYYDLAHYPYVPCKSTHYEQGRPSYETAQKHNCQLRGGHLGQHREGITYW